MVHKSPLRKNLRSLPVLLTSFFAVYIGIMRQIEIRAYNEQETSICFGEFSCA